MTGQETTSQNVHKEGRSMPLGKTITEFTLKITSLTYAADQGNSLSLKANAEGTSTGIGPVQGTVEVTNVGGKSGSWKFCSAAYLENGDALSGVGHGTYDTIGAHKWRTRGVEQLSDGRTVAVEGEVSLAAKTWTGKLIEWN
jgi:hypothetical protein